MNKYLNFLLIFISIILIVILLPFSLNVNYQTIDCKQIIKDNPNHYVICDDFNLTFGLDIFTFSIIIGIIVGFTVLFLVIIHYYNHHQTKLLDKKEI